MSAQLQTLMDESARFHLMMKSHLDQVVRIENTIYQYPWTPRNFSDSIDEGYCAEVLCTDAGQPRSQPRSQPHSQPQGSNLVGYFVLMLAVDEAHLLNISVAGEQQKKGYGRQLLQRAVALARQHQATSMILEVRLSNQRASAIYQNYGFEPIGVRKGYYPHSDHDRNLREDAIVMRLDLAGFKADIKDENKTELKTRP